MKTLLLTLTLILLLTAQSSPAQIWIHTFDIQPATVRQTPAHSRNYRGSNQPTITYRHGPYGGYNYRRAWTNYKVPDTSWGYRTSRPRAKDVGIHGPHKYGNPNPRSLYR